MSQTTVPDPEQVPARPARSLWACYDVRFLVAAAIAGVVLVASAWWSRELPKGSIARIAIALFEGAITAAVIIAMMRGIRRLDEMQQKIQLEALAFSFAGTGILATTYGFLINAGLPEIDWGTLVWPAMVVLWAIGLRIAGRRYR